MAEIREEFILVDRATDSIKRITSGLGGLATTLAGNSAILSTFTDGLGITEGAVDRLTSSMEELRGSSNSVETSIEEAGRRIQESGQMAEKAALGGYDKLLKKITRIAAGLLGIQSFSKLFTSALYDEAFEVRFQVRLQDELAGSALYGWVRDYANSLGRSSEQFLEATNNFLSVTTSPRNLQGLLDVSDRFSLLSNNDNYDSLANAIVQGFRTGSVRGLSNQTGISTNVFDQAGLQDAAKANDLNAYIEALNGVLELVGLTDEAYKNLQSTTNASFRRLTNNIKNYTKDAAVAFTRALSPAFDRLNDWFNSEKGVRFFYQLTAALELLGNVAAFAIDGLIVLLDFISDNFQTVIIAAIGLTTAFATRLLIAGASALAANWQIVAIVAGIALVTYALNELGVNFETQFGAIGRVIGSTIAFSINLGKLFLATFEGVATGIVVAFQSIPAGIAIVMQSLSDIVLGTLANIAGAIDAIFGSNLASSINQFRGVLYDNTQSYVASKLGTRESDILAGRNESELSARERKVLSDSRRAAQINSNRGLVDVNKTFEDWANPFGDIFGNFGAAIDNFSFDSDKVLGDLSDALGNFQGLDQLGDIDNVGTVGRIKNNEVTLANEDIKKFLDLIDRRNMQPVVNLTTLAPAINVEANPNSNEAIDYDRILDRIADMVDEQISSEAFVLATN